MRYSFLFIVFFYHYGAFAQDKQPPFFEYLLQNNLYNDATFYLSQLDTSDERFCYFQGRFKEAQGDYKQAFEWYGKLSEGDSLFERSLLCKFRCSLFDKRIKYDEQKRSSNDTLRELTAFTRYTKGLLLHDTLGRELQNDPSIMLKEEAEQMMNISRNWIQYGKSPLVAGVLSAIIPGAGKVYAHRPAQGLNSLILVSGFVFSAWEGYRNKGYNSPQFYLFSGLGAVFYIGNIWGSVSEIKLQKKRNQIRYEQELLDIYSSACQRVAY
jgi:hypothetical protein